MSIVSEDSGMKNTIMLSCREDEHLHKRMSDGKTFDKGPPLPATNGSRRWGLFLRLRKSHSQSSISRLSLRMHHAYIIYKTWIHYEIRHTHTRTRTIAAACWSHEVVRAAQLLCPEERDKEASDCAVTTAPHVPESCTPMFASRITRHSFADQLCLARPAFESRNFRRASGLLLNKC